MTTHIIELNDDVIEEADVVMDAGAAVGRAAGLPGRQTRAQHAQAVVLLAVEALQSKAKQKKALKTLTNSPSGAAHINMQLKHESSDN